MKFYKINADFLASKLPDDNMSKREFNENLRDCSKQYCYENNDSLYFFISRINTDSLTAGLILSDSAYDVSSIVFPWEKMRLEINSTTAEEICSSEFMDLLNEGNHNNYSETAGQIIMRFGIRKICTTEGGLLSESVAYNERLIDDTLSPEDMRASARSLLWENDMIPELERIEEHARIEGVEGHPIHYIFAADDYENRNEMVYTLLSSLYQNKRLLIKRSCSISLSNLNDRELTHLGKLYECYSGGAVIIRYRKSATEEANVAGVDIEFIEEICALIKSYKNRVLTILCFPSNCTKEKEQFFSFLDNMTFLTLSESAVGKERAIEYLKRKSETSNCRTCKTLIEEISEQRLYRIFELNLMFDKWIESYIKTEVYPQYKDVLSVKTECMVQKPKGTAYDKLQRMVGLAEVKSVIDSALDYFKAQKIFKAKGAFCHNPSMHMVFTGNPGTAKTTVARLFAEILHDNNILSSGHLVEVGRGDIVEKYVGWTAKAVKAKFKEAQGGILFIDEAYSLVDGRDGSFGDEAINTIVQEMENNRGDLVVVFAGYTDKMSSFFDKNPGLRSRIAFHIPFSDYSPDELCRIAELMSEDNKLLLEEKAKDKMYEILAEAVKQSDFGNGRYVRNLIEKAMMRQATRVVRGKSAEEISETDLHTLLSEDFESDLNKKSEKNKRKIGFCA